MKIFDLGIAWNRSQDNDFVYEINDAVLKEGLSPYLLHSYNFYSSLKDVSEDKISFRFFIDRTRGHNSVFTKLADFLNKKDIVFINHPVMAKRSIDKSAMLLDFINQGIRVPLSVIINPQDDEQTLTLKTKNLYKPFVLKPAEGTVAESLLLDTISINDIQKLKGRYGDIAYLAQEKILPIDLENRPARFKVFYCLGKVIPCWWDPQTAIYDIVTLRQVYKFALSGIWPLTKSINRICKLAFFSTEVVMKDDKNFVVVDYVDVYPDMRKKSKFTNGLPDEAVKNIIDNIVSFVKEKTNKDG